MSFRETKWLLVDDHAMFADALSITLSMLRPSLSIDIATTAQAALEQIQDTQYELVILDLQMPDLPCIELYSQMKRSGTDATMICSAVFQPQKAFALRKLGVQGYITKESEAVDILNFSDRILAGESWVCAPQYAKQLERFEYSKTLLTERQVSILALLDQGATTKQVAQTLHLSENTIKTHVRLMFDKLGSSNRAECISNAKKLNLL